jgi:hypothetical protein
MTQRPWGDKPGNCETRRGPNGPLVTDRRACLSARICTGRLRGIVLSSREHAPHRPTPGSAPQSAPSTPTVPQGPDARGAVHKPFLTSPPQQETGRLRSGTQQRVRPAGQRGETNRENPSPSAPGSPGWFPPHPASLAPSWPTQGTPTTGRHPADMEQTGSTRYRISSASGLHLPRSAQHTTALVSGRGRDIRPGTLKPCQRSLRGRSRSA